MCGIILLLNIFGWKVSNLNGLISVETIHLNINHNCCWYDSLQSRGIYGERTLRLSSRNVWPPSWILGRGRLERETNFYQEGWLVNVNQTWRLSGRWRSRSQIRRLHCRLLVWMRSKLNSFPGSHKKLYWSLPSETKCTKVHIGHELMNVQQRKSWKLMYGLIYNNHLILIYLGFIEPSLAAY